MGFPHLPECASAHPDCFADDLCELTFVALKCANAGGDPRPITNPGIIDLVTRDAADLLKMQPHCRPFPSRKG